VALLDLLRQRRSDLIRIWIDRALEVYPEDSSGFLKGQKDPFANPTGNTIATEIEHLFDALLRSAPREEVSPHLDPIIQMTCIQEVAPSRAVSFAFQLKDVLRTELAAELRDRSVLEELLEFEDRIDRLAMWAFDSHTGFLQRISRIRVREAKARVSTLLKMVGVDWDDLPSHERNPRGCGR